MKHNEQPSFNSFKLSSFIVVVITSFYLIFVIGTVEQLFAMQTMTSNVEVDGNAPFGMAYDPKNERIYVTNSESNTVSVIDTNTNSVLGNPIKVGMTPKGIAYDPENERIYVTNFGSDTVSIIDTNSNRVSGSTISVGTSPVGIAYDPVNHRMYTANLDNNSLSVIDVTTNKVLDRQIELGMSPKGIAYDSNNKRMYVTSFAEKGRISIIDTNTNTLVGDSIEIGSVPQSIAYDSEDHRMYVTNYESNSVSVIDTNSTLSESSSIDVDAPYGLAFDHTKKRLYVSSPSNGLINVIDTKTNTVLEDSVHIDGSPQRIVYDPANERLYVANYNTSSISVIQMISLNTTLAFSIDGLGNDVTNGSTSTSDKITFGFNDTADPSSVRRGYECSLDGSEFVLCISPQTFDKLQPKSEHIFEVRGVDEYGNVEQSPAKYVWLVGEPVQQGVGQHTGCAESMLKDRGMSNFRNSDIAGNSFEGLTDEVRTAGAISSCVGTEDASNSAASRNTDRIQHLMQPEGAVNNAQVGNPTDESSPRKADGNSFRCNISNNMLKSTPLVDAEDGLCSPADGGKIQEQINQGLPQISSQQFKQRTNATTQNIPLVLPF